MKYNAKIIDSDNCYDALYTATVQRSIIIIPQKMKTIKLTGKIMHCRYLLLTDVLHIPDLILKLFFLNFFQTSYFPYDGQNGSQSSKSNGKDNKFKLKFL